MQRYASVHTDRSGRVFVSEDHRAAGWDGAEPLELTDAIPLPAEARLVPLEREALAVGREGRIRSLGRGRLALGAVLPPGRIRLLHPAYREDAGADRLDALACAAVGADANGDLVVAADDIQGSGPPPTETQPSDIATSLRERPANRLVRQLARCARDHACRAARSGAGRGELPVPLGAPSAERPPAPVDLRSGYPGSPTEMAAFRPSAKEILEVARGHLDRGGASVSFGRACDGEPLLAIRVMEEAIVGIRARSAEVDIHLETTGAGPGALRRALDAGLTRVTFRIGSARADTYEALHGPVAHRWTDVRASLELSAERGVPIAIALLVLPGLTDRDAEIEALVTLLGDLPGGTLELRDLGADPVRALAMFPRGRPAGVRALLARLAEADHFPLRPLAEAATA